MQPELAFLLFKYFPYGGLQSDFLRIAQACQKRGFRIVVYVRSWEGDKPEGFDIRMVPVSAISNHGKAKQFACWMKKEIQTKSYAAVIGFNRMPGLDIYFAADNCYALKSRNERSFLYRLSSRFRTYHALEKAVFSFSSKTVVLLISELQKKGYAECYATPESRLQLLPPGMDPARRRPEDAEAVRENLRDQLGVTAGQFMLLQVGSGFVTKGLDRSIRALASLPEPVRKQVRFFIAGKDRSDPFERLAEKLGVRKQVVFLGGRDDVPALMLAADVLIQPSINEAAGIVLLEALAAGVPVICSGACGHAIHVERSGGGIVLAEPFEQDTLNTVLDDLLSNGNFLEMSTKGLEFANTIDLYSQHERAADIIESVAEKKN